MARLRSCWLAFIVIGPLAGCSFEIIKGSGVAKTEKRDVGAFHEVETSGAVQLNLVVGPATSVEVTTDDNIMPMVMTEVSGERLKIHVQGNSTTGLGIKVKATTPNLSALHANGATQCTVSGLDAKQFALHVNGASNVKLTGKSEDFNVDVNGASKCTLTGEAKKLAVNCSGASGANTLELAAEEVKVTVDGASTAEVKATKKLTAKASGASKILYAGTPSDLKTEAATASSIKPK